MANVFSEIGGLNAREQALSQLVLQLALHVDADDELTKNSGLDNQQVGTLKELIGKYERDLSTASPTLSSLLAKSAKSSCCS